MEVLEVLALLGGCAVGTFAGTFGMRMAIDWWEKRETRRRS